MGLFNRYRANAFEIGTWSDQPRPVVKYIVCLQAARINHSCTPNAYLDFNTTINRVTVHAIADIHAEQEITISYCLPHYNQKYRWGDLAHYGFTCRCTVCQPTVIGRQKEALHALMQETWLNLYDQNGTELWHPGQSPLVGILEMILLLDREKLNVGAISILYQRAVRIFIEAGEDNRALEFAEKKLEVELLRLGPDSPLTQETRRCVRNLKSRLAIDPQLLQEDASHGKISTLL